jgi:hypothetical protein
VACRRGNLIAAVTFPEGWGFNRVHRTLSTPGSALIQRGLVQDLLTAAGVVDRNQFPLEFT